MPPSVEGGGFAAGKDGGRGIVETKIISKRENSETIPQSHYVRQLPLHKGALD